MNIEFFSITCDRKKINKNARPIATVPCNIKTPCSIMSPVVEVTKDSIGTSWYKINYAKVESFGRYYFVDNITAENDGIISMQLTVDVLYTYRNQLMSTQFQIQRAQRNYDPDYIDNQIPLLVNKAIRQDKNTDFLGSIPQDTGAGKNNYVMTVAGG